MAETLVEQAAGQTELTVQATVSLQSAPGSEDSGANVATGTVHLYSVRTAADDAADVVHQFEQPVAVLTLRRRPKHMRG